MAYRDELEALRARLAAVEAERDLALGRLRRLEERATGRLPAASRFDPEVVSVPGGEPTSVRIENRSARKVVVFWLSYEGYERRAGTLVPGGSIREQTYVGHCWRFVDASTGETLAEERVEPSASEQRIAFGG